MNKFVTAALIGFALPMTVFGQSGGTAAARQESAVATQEQAPADPIAQAQTQAAPPNTAPAPAQAAPAAAVDSTSAPTPEPEPVPLEAVQEVVELAAENAPKPLQPWLAALGGALGAAVLIFGAQTAMKKAARKKTCVHCNGTGRAGTCLTCKGTKQVEEEQEETLECPNCEGEGESECARCEGEGGTDTMSCAECKGEGTSACKLCLGQGEAEVKLKKNAPCPDCQ